MADAHRHIDDTYARQDEIPWVEPRIIRELSRLKPWRSLFAIGVDWLIVLLCILVCVNISYWLYPLAFVIIGTRYHGLEAMMHEATHFRLHPNRKLNELIGELSVWPIGLSVYLYRHARHFSHHKHIGTIRDAHVPQSYRKYPDRFDIPMSPWRLLRHCVVVALKFPGEVWFGQGYRSAILLWRLSRKKAILWIGFQLSMILFVVVGTLLWGLSVLWIYLLFFVLPLMWLAVISRYLRLLTEHFGIPVAQEAVAGAGTRTVLVSWPVRVLLWPHKLNYHIEHHWYPSVPFYHLPALHWVLCDSDDIRKQMHITHGLKNLFRELTRARNTSAMQRDYSQNMWLTSTTKNH